MKESENEIQKVADMIGKAFDADEALKQAGLPWGAIGDFCWYVRIVGEDRFSWEIESLNGHLAVYVSKDVQTYDLRMESAAVHALEHTLRLAKSQAELKELG